jgi:hypothetical protein
MHALQDFILFMRLPFFILAVIGALLVISRRKWRHTVRANHEERLNRELDKLGNAGPALLVGVWVLFVCALIVASIISDGVTP